MFIVLSNIAPSSVRKSFFAVAMASAIIGWKYARAPVGISPTGRSATIDGVGVGSADAAAAVESTFIAPDILIEVTCAVSDLGRKREAKDDDKNGSDGHSRNVQQRFGGDEDSETSRVQCLEPNVTDATFVGSMQTCIPSDADRSERTVVLLQM